MTSSRLRKVAPSQRRHETPLRCLHCMSYTFKSHAHAHARARTLTHASRARNSRNKHAQHSTLHARHSSPRTSTRCIRPHHDARPQRPQRIRRRQPCRHALTLPGFRAHRRVDAPALDVVQAPAAPPPAARAAPRWRGRAAAAGTCGGSAARAPLHLRLGPRCALPAAPSPAAARRCRARLDALARGLHSSTFRLNVTCFLWDTLGVGGVSLSVTKTAQVELILWHTLGVGGVSVSPSVTKAAQVEMGMERVARPGRRMQRVCTGTLVH